MPYYLGDLNRDPNLENYPFVVAEEVIEHSLVARQPLPIRATCLASHEDSHRVPLVADGSGWHLFLQLSVYAYFISPLKCW